MDISELTQRLAAGASLSTLAVSVLPEQVRVTLGRCAVARTFDSELYNTVLRTDGGPALDELIGLGQVEPDSPGRYQVCEGLRDGAWESWWVAAAASPPVVPDELRRFSATLAEASHESGDSLDELRHLIIANQPRARELFLNLYGEADARLDLAACHNVIGVLSDPDMLPLLEPQTLALLQDRQLHVQARSMWYLEHHQSTRYLGRRELERPLEELVRGTPARVLQLHAKGGMGKTMQLRWFIARYCVPRRIPCARLDFDVLDLTNAVHHPWLLLLESARQLNRQMDRAPFTELLRDHGAYLTVLSHQHGEAARSGSNALGAAAIARVDQDDVRFRFARTLAERDSSSPVFIVLDTLEEVLLRSGGDPGGVLDTLADELDQLPCVRLVLSGRYDLAERIDGFHERFPDAVSLTVGPFDDEQARRYLTEIRRVERPELTDAVVRRAGGLPFTLAAFADLLRQDPDLTPEDLDQCDDPALLYCIERVVERIDDDRLQWLLRYGVVPRRLSFDFLLHVMRPYLVEGMAGTEEDRPDRDVRPARRREVFRTGTNTFPDNESDLRDLWTRFTTYASDYSWISVSGTEPDTVVFHDDVVRPLRQLLSPQPVFRALHEQAARFYTERAAAQPGRWLSDTKDTLYHRFQAGDPSAPDLWLASVHHAREQGEPDWVKELCREVLSRDYLGEDGTPLPNPAGEPMVGYPLVAEARLQLSRVVAEQARSADWPGDHPEWSVVDTALSDAIRLAKRHKDIRLDPIVVAVVQASVLLARGQARKAAEVVRDYATGSLDDSPQSRDAVLVFAEAMQQLGETEDGAIALLGKAHELSRQLGDRPSTVKIALSLSRAWLAVDAVDEAMRWAATARADATTEAEQEDAALAEAVAAIEAGRPAAALGQLDSLTGPRADHLRSRARLALRAPLQALDLCITALDDSRRMPPNQLPHLVATSAEIYAELLEFETALDALVQAIDMCRTVRDSEAAARWAAAAARLHFYGTGDLRETAQFLDEADGLKPDVGGESWLSVRLLRAVLLDAMGTPGAADRMMNDVLAIMEQRAQPPSRWVRVALTGLRLTGRASRYFPLLLTHLARIESPIRRLVLLRDLRFVSTLEEIGAGERKQLIDLARAARAANSLTPDERAALGLIDAELERLGGSRWTAANILNDTCRQLAPHEPFVWWDWIQAMDRLGPASHDEPPGATEGPAAFRAHYPPHDTLYGAYLTLLVGRRAHIDPPDVLQSQVESADSALRRGSRRTHQLFARLFRIRAELAAIAGDAAAEHRLGASALSVLAELGHPTDTTATRRYDLAADIPVVPTSHEIAMTVELNDSTVRVVAARPDSAEVIIDQPTETVGEDVPLGQRFDMLAALADRPVSWAEDSPETKAFLRALKRVLARPTRLHLRLMLADPRLHGVPWELVSLRAHQLSRLAEVRTCYRAPARELTRQTEVRLLQQLLTDAGTDCGPVDGLFGPLTQAGVREFQTKAGLPATGTPDQAIWQNLRRRWGKPKRPVSVLVLQRSRSRSIKFQRGSEDLDVPLFYRFNNIAVSVLENPTPEQLERYSSGAAGKPDVVHIRAAMEAGHGTPYLDFAASVDYSAMGNYESRPERLYVTPLARFIQQVGRNDLMPLVILDIETPPVQQEAIRAMTLRNEFAHQLLALGSAQAILATGVGTTKEQEKMYHSISDGLRGGATAAQIAKRVHMLSHPGAAFLSLLPPEAQLPIGAL